MSVITSWDEAKERLENSISQAIVELNTMLNKNTWGYDEIHHERLEELIDLQTQLRKIQLKI